MLLDCPTNKEPHLHFSLIATTGSSAFETKCNKRSSVLSSALMFFIFVALLASPENARAFSRVTSPSVQKTKPPVRVERQVEKQANDDAFEILPDRVLQHVMRGDQLTRLRQYDQAVEEYRAA